MECLHAARRRHSTIGVKVTSTYNDALPPSELLQAVGSGRATLYVTLRDTLNGTPQLTVEEETGTQLKSCMRCGFNGNIEMAISPENFAVSIALINHMIQREIWGLQGWPVAKPLISTTLSLYTMFAQ